MHRAEDARRRLAERRRKRIRDNAARCELIRESLYSLPNSEEVVVGVGCEGHYFLYHPLVWAGREWVINLPVAYEVKTDGQILTGRGESTRWRVEDLTHVREAARGTSNIALRSR